MSYDLLVKVVFGFLVLAMLLQLAGPMIGAAIYTLRGPGRAPAPVPVDGGRVAPYFIGCNPSPCDCPDC